MSFIYKSVIDEQYQKLTIAILRYRTLIKVNWTKQEQIKETPLKILDESNNYFLWNIAVKTVKKTTDINFTGKNIFWQNWYLYHHCRSNFIQQSSVDQNSNYHFIYLPFGWTAKCFHSSKSAESVYIDEIF